MTISVGRVAMIPLKSILISERIREEMGDLNGLESNMRESGLIQPLAVMDNQDKTYRLLAGERRLIILERNQIDPVPARIYDELTDLQMKVIEKAENFHRKDMEYYEFDQLTLEIHQMQQELHGAKPPGPGGEGWSTQDTAGMLSFQSAGSVTESIKRAQAREAFPELFEGCKTASDASKVLKKVDEAIVKQTIAQRLEAQKSGGTLHDLSKRFIIKDFFEGVREIPDSIMHLVEVDPPYAINLDGSGRGSSAKKDYAYGENYNEVDANAYIYGEPGSGWLGLRTVFEECYRVMAQHSWLICWFAPEPWFSKVHDELGRAGFETTRMCGIWPKHFGQSKRPEMHLANSYEMFFYAWKGRPAINKAGRSNEFDYSPVPAQQKAHPTERPVELMHEIYETFAFSGSRVLIPFLGSGNGLIAAHQLGMEGVGFELSKGYKDSFLVRVHSMK